MSKPPNLDIARTVLQDAFLDTGRLTQVARKSEANRHCVVTIRLVAKRMKQHEKNEATPVWLTFFREIRRLAKMLDDLEAAAKTKSTEIEIETRRS